jgi:UDP-galactopyranose mutase
MEKHQIIIVGAGISGATLAERYASLGKSVLVLEKRGHIGGNCYDYYDQAGVLVSKYGAHLFHTDFEDVWEYVNRFSKWRPYEHRVLAKVDGKLVPVPVNITTVNLLLGLNIKNENEMRQWLNSVQAKIAHPKNGEEAALSSVGPYLYEKIFKNYTKKQWDKDPKELDASVLQRIPVRYNFDDRYFQDKHQALPEGGYTKFFEAIFAHPNVTVRLNTDFFDVRNKIGGNFEKMFYTGPIDQFFDFKFSIQEKLEYRSLKFEFITFDKEFFQESSVVNYPSDSEDFTRIVEYKHFWGQKLPKTTISKEYPCDDGEPYYPVPSPNNNKIFARYQAAAEQLEKQGTYFVGRLANYKYFNMDQAFKNALDLFNRLEPKKDL